MSLDGITGTITFVYGSLSRPYTIIAHRIKNPLRNCERNFSASLTHLCPPLRSTFAVSLKPLRDDSALRTLSSLRGLRGAPAVPPLCRETSVSRTAKVGTWLRKRNGGQKWVNPRGVSLSDGR